LAWAREHRPESNGQVEGGDSAGGKKARGK
jgi:hypothetical protein